MTEGQRILIEKMLHWASEIENQDGSGALHIFIEDGNCDDDNLSWCASQSDITQDEIAFLEAIRADLSEEAIFGAWALANARERAGMIVVETMR